LGRRIAGEPQLPVEIAPRAHRYPLHLPVLYREVGDVAWHRGLTGNLSRSGVLFEAESLLPARTRLEIGLLLIDGATAPQVMCQGVVVRSLAESLEVAARISSYRFVGRTCGEGSGESDDPLGP
jgi:hypothetical protein